MILKNSHALLAALALAAAPAFAQDAETPAPEDATTEQPAAPAETAPEAGTEPATEPAADEAAPAEDAPGDAATGEEAAEGETPAPAETAPGAEQEAEAEPGEPRVGSYYVRSTHNDWTVRCIRTEEGPDPCELYQLMQDQEDNAVAEMTLIPLRNGNVAAGATLIAPLETDLIQGLGFGVDNAEPRGYPFSFCAPVGCVSRMGFTPDELNGMKRGNKAVVTLLPFGADPEQPVRLDLSLSGFTAAFNEVQQLAEEAGDAAPTVIEESNTPAPEATSPENTEMETPEAAE
ncbi:invasion associated locus B family protein [Paracoccus siganidrum]|uniref:Invasion associated locus B family protein n=1 Tax=Paracoccus siganidrum TaxID=1276757 RepID=A0A419A6T6_9RHOB|nr:invasion associated locus B family protein [Paracoccus siganidrum]RJL16306.1 invasion associated locus B family protein [Paracoccus siganidrum]RMC40580.1 invasion associated locus B family protein [Paracoccus siganidrum]